MDESYQYNVEQKKQKQNSILGGDTHRWYNYEEQRNDHNRQSSGFL